MDKATKAKYQEAHASRQFQLLASTDGNPIWDAVPDSVILDLVRGYSTHGDAVLFGQSKDLSVGAIRVYRAGHGYSVYFRGIERLGEALDRLERYRPRRRVNHGRVAVSPSAVPVLSKQPLVGVPDWYNLPPVNKQETPISRERVQYLASLLAHRYKNRVDSC